MDIQFFGALLPSRMSWDLRRARTIALGAHLMPPQSTRLAWQATTLDQPRSRRHAIRFWVAGQEISRACKVRNAA
jgi:hypothetical protein